LTANNISVFESARGRGNYSYREHAGSQQKNADLSQSGYQNTSATMGNTFMNCSTQPTFQILQNKFFNISTMAEPEKGKTNRTSQNADGYNYLDVDNVTQQPYPKLPYQSKKSYLRS